jgi:phage terminase large subunit-like protein
VDPSGADDTDNADNDEIGIVVAALGTDGIAYIVEDLTLKAGPAKWGHVVGTAFDRHAADRVVGEANYGGAMVKHVVQTARPGTPYIPVTATRGKVVRAEPISSLAEQGKVRMVGFHPRLEDELCGMTSSGYVGDKSPNRADAYVWAVTELFPALTRKKKEVKKSRQFSANRAGRDGWMAA